MLYKIVWNLATEEALYKGAYIVAADDAEHAIERAKEELGPPECDAAAWRVKEAYKNVMELGRNTIASDPDPARPLPSFGPRELFAFEVAARANIVADSEETAFKRFGYAVKQREGDGKYVKLLRTVVLEKESVDVMSRFEKAQLEKGFRQMVQGGGVSPR